MGWVFNGHATRASLIGARTATKEQTQAGGIVVKATCLAHCYRGGATFGVLWSAWERTGAIDGRRCGPTRRWINCDVLIARGRFDWGYKALDESMGPPYVSCPMSYLEMVPMSQFGGNAGWRDRLLVRQNRQAEVRRATKAARRPIVARTPSGSRALIGQPQSR